MKINNNFRNHLISFFILFHGCLHADAQAITAIEIDSLVERTMRTFDVPGIAVAIVKDDQIVHAKGYGVRSLSSKQKVDEKTLFGIASNSKAFTAAALAILTDEKRISWDDRVIDYIPEFRLYSPYVSEEFTIRDLLTHRSGLGLGAGDLMIFPGNNNFTTKDIVYNLRFLQPVSSFRSKFDYDNLLYIVAGELVSRVSGVGWEKFIETRIMEPLKMVSSAGSFTRLKDTSNVIAPHAPVNGKVQVIERDFSEVCNPAGGIYSNLTDMSNWIKMQMNHGKYSEGLSKTLFSNEVHRDMWTPQTILPVGDSTAYNTHFVSYGLGWFLSDVKGFKQVAHTGGLAGIVTQVTLIPEMKLGIIVFTNQQSGEAFTAITNTIKDSYFGMKGIDRVKQYELNSKLKIAEAKKITDAIWNDIEIQQKKATVKTDYSLYTGTYSDKWFGEVLISLKNGKFWLDSKKSPKLTGELLSYKGNTFIVKWSDRSFDADAYVMFSLDNNGKATGIKMNAISPLTDFSFDFQDLNFTR